MKQLPKFLKRYFWDVDFSKLNKEENTSFIIERILEEGDEKAVKWLRKNFVFDEIKKVLCNSKNISKKSANFWRIIFNLRKDKILCLRKSFQEERKLIWKH